MFNLPEKPKVIVGIATSGRASILKELICQLERQTVQPDKIIICYRVLSDIDGIDQNSSSGSRFLFFQGEGLTPQRNVILDHANDSDIILFLDDDFFPEYNYIKNLIALFKNNDDVLAATGHVVADGAVGPGLSVEAALKRLKTIILPIHSSIKDVFNTYGCNMAFRLAAIYRYELRFDERLPLYGWYEDIDFSRRFLPYGRIVKSDMLQGIHLGSKKGKTSGIRLGYSQVVNPFYLANKGSYLWGHAIKSAARHTLINLVKSFRPEPWVDRKGRMKGNMKGWKDLLRGKLNPERILEL